MKTVLIALFLLCLPALAWGQTCVQADNKHPDLVALVWTDNSTDESGFILERKQDAGAYAVLVAAGAANLTSYNDSTIKRGSVPTTYTYRVRAYRTEADKTVSQSPNSNEACITFAPVIVAPLPLPAPTGLTISAISSTGFRITWEDTTAYPGYVLDGKQSRGNDVFTQIAALPVGTATYDWTGRRKYTPYCVRLRGDRADAAYTSTTCATTSK